MKRQKWQVERYAIVRLLKSLPRFRLALPATLVHDDKPDFKLALNGSTVAIEATEAVSELDAHQSRVLGGLIASGAKVDALQPVVLRSPNDVPLTKAQLAANLYNKPEFYAGDVVEENWVVAMQHFVSEKLSKFPSYEDCEIKWLLIYDNWPSMSLDLPDACCRLQSWLDESSAFAILDSIFIIHSKELVEFTLRGFTRRELRSPKLFKKTRKMAGA